MLERTAQHVGEAAEHMTADNIAFPLTDGSAHRFRFVDRHGKMVGPENHQPFDEADLHRHLLVDAGIDLRLPHGLGALEPHLRFDTGFRVTGQIGFVDQGDICRLDLCQQRGFRIAADTFGPARLGS